MLAKPTLVDLQTWPATPTHPTTSSHRIEEGEEDSQEKQLLGRKEEEEEEEEEEVEVHAQIRIIEPRSQGKKKKKVN